MSSNLGFIWTKEETNDLIRTAVAAGVEERRMNNSLLWPVVAKAHNINRPKSQHRTADSCQVRYYRYRPHNPIDGWMRSPVVTQ